MNRPREGSASRLLIDEPPLQVLPSLAAEIGLNESIFVQQLHYWLSSPYAHEIEGEAWVYNTYEAWNEQFPFWSYNTIRRVIEGLERSGIIKTTARFNRRSGDRTKWYTIRYEKVNALAKTAEQLPNLGGATAQIAPTEVPNLGPALPETTQRLSTKNSTTEGENAQADSPLPDDVTGRCLLLLRKVKGFPRDEGKVARAVAELREKFPRADAVKVCEEYEYKHRVGDYATKKHLSRLRAFFKQGNERVEQERGKVTPLRGSSTHSSTPAQTASEWAAGS